MNQEKLQYKIIGNITIRYTICQIFFYSLCAGTSSFAATYLLDKGFNTAQIGMILAVSNMASCFFQPILGDILDRMKTFVLPKVIILIFIGVITCLASIQFLELPMGLFGFLYGMALFLAFVTNTVNNSLCAYYNNHNYPVNYGVGAGAGSLAYSFACLGFGYLMAWFGVDWMIWCVIVLSLLVMFMVHGYPNLTLGELTVGEETKEERVSIIEFFGRYKRFVFTLIGVMLVAMCHSMAENYLIAIFQEIGGNSEDVGIAMFAGCFSAVPFFLFFDRLRKKIDITFFLRSAGVFFVLKMVLLLLATEVWHVYLIQLLQTFTYAFLYQPLYYFARRHISEADLVKGQAMGIALYTLGTAFGSLVGGRVLDSWGVDFMLMLAATMAFIGTVIINTSLRKY